jgi:hypothetical protein
MTRSSNTALCSRVFYPDLSKYAKWMSTRKVSAGPAGNGLPLERAMGIDHRGSDIFINARMYKGITDCVSIALYLETDDILVSTGAWC